MTREARSDGAKELTLVTIRGDAFALRICCVLLIHQRILEREWIGSVSYTHLTLPTNREV